MVFSDDLGFLLSRVALRESKILFAVRRIKEQIAREAEGDPGYYQRLNGLGAKLMDKYRAKKRKTVGR
jgi:hypothetical protein